jgi:hypothetical protein
MAQLFPKYSNTVARVAVPAALCSLGAITWAWHAALFTSYATGVGMPVEQPVPFSHKHHVGQLGIDCRYCHTGVETSPFAGLPPTETCMTCHSQIWRDAPMLAPVRESWATGRPIHWTRVNDLPDYVYFDHSIHIQKGVACVSCHGRVDEMPLMTKAHSLYMRWCLDCHRAPESHQVAASEVFAMRDDRHPVGERQFFSVHAASGQTRLEDCSICHR